MSALERVMAVLRRLSPVFPSSDPDTSVGKELGSIAVPLAMAADAVDSVADEIFPDTATQTLPRWESVTHVPTRPGDDVTLRRARVLSVLRRTSGPRLDQLALMLAGPLDIAAEDILFIEQARQDIEDGIAIEAPTQNTALPATVVLKSYLPDFIDDTGVSIRVSYAAAPTVGTIQLTHPDGTSKTWSATGINDSYYDRATFLGKRAAGPWTLTVTDSVANTFVSARLVVSNVVDSAQIYNFYAFRDPLLAGTADVVEAQRLFRRTALGHMNAKVIETMSFVVDDPHSLCDRDPVGV